MKNGPSHPPVPRETAPPGEDVEWALALYRKSVLKQEKYRRISSGLPDVTDAECLDIGGDNGLISYLLRQHGGRWQSADLDSASVSAIRRLVGGEVRLMDDGPAPYKDARFDVVVIIDFLEHVQRDDAVIREMARILKPGGHLIVNVPHIRPRSVLNRLRHAIGLTDEQHGHVRPGYTLAGLHTMLSDSFTIQESVTYSKAFSELVDVILNGSLHLLRRVAGGREGAKASRKGGLVTENDWRRHHGQVRVLNVAYPVFWIMSKCDVLLPFQRGYKLLMTATRTSAPAPANRPDEATSAATSGTASGAA